MTEEATNTDPPPGDDWVTLYETMKLERPPRMIGSGNQAVVDYWRERAEKAETELAARQRTAIAGGSVGELRRLVTIGRTVPVIAEEALTLARDLCRTHNDPYDSGYQIEQLERRLRAAGDAVQERSE